MKLIPLSKGKAFAQVDDEDYDELMKYSWSVVTGPGKTKVQYAMRRTSVGGGRGIGRGKRINIYMHKVLLPPPENRITDHKDRNGLNNQRSNLRIATYRQNSCNCSRPDQEYRGVYFEKNRTPGFCAIVKIQGKKKFLGYFETREEAARAYDSLAVEYHGEFAVLNFPEEATKPLKNWPTGGKGERNSKAKLTNAQVIEIKKALRNGSKCKELAKRYGVHETNVINISKGRLWSSVTIGD